MGVKPLYATDARGCPWEGEVILAPVSALSTPEVRHG